MNNETHFIYDEYGTITATVFCDQNSIDGNTPDGHFCLSFGEDGDDFDANLFYVDVLTETIVPKSPWPDTSWVLEKQILQLFEFDVPVGTRVIWPDGTISVETDGVMSFDFDASGSYKFILKAPKYLKKEIVVNVLP